MNLAVLTVRTASHRLPGKALLPIGRNMILGMVMERLSYCRSIDLIAMATTNGLEDIPLLKLASRWGIALDLGISGDVVSQTVRLADQIGRAHV